MAMEDNDREETSNLTMGGAGNRKYEIEKVELIGYLEITITFKGNEEREIEKNLTK